MYRFLMAFTVLILLGCESTGKVWSEYKPDEYAYVVSDGVDPEPQLKKAGVAYYCKKLMQSSSGLDKACYIEKTLAQKTSDFSDAVIKTPKALAQDIIVVGKVTLTALAAVLGNGYHN